jgi:hypothetical protein
MPYTDLDYTGAAGADAGLAGSPVDRSGTITTGGTAQQLAAANAGRVYLLVQNIGSANLWVNWTGTATQAGGSVSITPGGSAEWSAGGTGFVPRGAISIIGPTTAQAFTAKEA